MENLPSFDKKYPIANNLHPFKNASDFNKGEFPSLPDSNLHIIIGIREASLINFEKTCKPINHNEPYVAHCHLGCTVFGPDPYLNEKQIYD